MTNQLEVAKEWLSDLNKIVDITGNEHTKQKRDVLEWLVESVEELKFKNRNLNHELGGYSSDIHEIARNITQESIELQSLAKKMLKGESQ